MQMVCFLDYRDFFHFNFPEGDTIPAEMPQRPLNEEEETRLVIMKLHVTRIEPPSEDDHPEYPVVHFEGISHSMDNPWDDNANSNLRGEMSSLYSTLVTLILTRGITPGMCRMTKHSQVHWTTFSIIEGQDRWRSESIQLGGVKSGRGVIGNWFDANYEPQGPWYV